MGPALDQRSRLAPRLTGKTQLAANRGPDPPATNPRNGERFPRLDLGRVRKAGVSPRQHKQP